MFLDKFVKYDIDLIWLKIFDKDFLKNIEEYLVLLFRYLSMGEYEIDGYWGKYLKF